MINEGLSRREELTCWADWAGMIDQAAVTPAGRGVVQWAVDEMAGFYGDEWFARHARARHLPVMSLYDFPLSSPIAVVRLVERAARIALLPNDVSVQLTDGPNGIRRSPSVDEFEHLEVVLEVIGLALRAGWTIEAEVPTTRGRLPDLRLTRGTMSYTVEVTTQGTDREFQAVERQGDLLHSQQFTIEFHFKVECTTRLSRLLTEAEFNGFLAALVEAGRSTGQSGTVSEVDLDWASATVYPEGNRPADESIHNGPLLSGDLWPRFGQRLREKAERTAGGDPAWIRIDENGGLLLLTPAVHLPIGDQLSLLEQYVTAELEGFPHVRGVVISHGALPDWIPSQPQPAVQNQLTGSAALERRLPGARRRRTFVIPVRRSGLFLPGQHLAFDAARWYDDEPRWLDWALNGLGQPSLTRLVTGELARSLIVSA